MCNDRISASFPVVGCVLCEVTNIYISCACGLRVVYLERGGERDGDVACNGVPPSRGRQTDIVSV